MALHTAAGISVYPESPAAQVRTPPRLSVSNTDQRWHIKSLLERCICRPNGADCLGIVINDFRVHGTRFHGAEQTDDHQDPNEIRNVVV